MTDRSHSDSGVPTWGQVLINVLYALGCLVGFLVGVYGAYIFVVGVIIAPGFSFLDLPAAYP
jgi:hypothetical protein